MRSLPPRLASFSVLLATTAFAVAAHAQTAGAPTGAPVAGDATGAAQDAVLPDIVVTANKRPEQLRKVPESVSVVTGEELQEQHIQGFPDLSRALPSLSFSGASGQGSGLSNIEIRGISSLAGQSTVGVYLDDISLTSRNLYSQGVAEPRFFDVSRVEVLRGPQGTLYGASAEGGVIKVLTNQPKLGQVSASFSADGSGTVGATGPNYGFTAIANAPLGDKAAVRLGYQYGFQSGWIDQVDAVTGATRQAGINAERDNVFRIAVRIEPTDRLTITPSFFYQHVTTSDIGNTYLDLDGYKTSKRVREPGLDELFIPSLTVNYDAGFADITSVTSYFYRNFPRVQDGTLINVTEGVQALTFDPTIAAALGNLTSPIQLNNAIRQWSQELRVTSKPYDPNARVPIDWIGGLYVSDERTSVSDSEPVPGLNATFARFGASASDPSALDGSFPNALPNDNTYFSSRRYETTQYAAFGEVTYHVSSSVRLTGGLRYLYGRDNLNRGGDYFFNNGPANSTAASKSYALTPKFAVGWDVTPEQTLYANAAKGFRLGSENRPIPLTVLVQNDLASLGLPGLPPVKYGADKLWNYEAGLKSRMLDGRLNTTVAVFYIKWTDIQQDILLPTSGYDFETNFGSAESFGGELEARYRVSDALTVGASGSYNDAHLTTGNAVLGIKSGTWVQGAPRYSGLLTATYDFHLGELPLYARGDVRFVGESHGSLLRDDADYHRPSYVVADASVGGEFRAFDWSVFARNLTNNNRVIQRPNVQGLVEATRLLPLTVGVNVSRQF